MQSGNVKGSFYMMLGMIGFSFNDAIMKLVMVDMGFLQSIFIRGLLVTVVIGLYANRIGALKGWRRHMNKLMILRVICELLGTICFLTALAEISLADASAILQFMPLAVTLGAALFLGEPVGWRRYLAIFIGFSGVMLIIRPDAAGIDPYHIVALGTVLFMVIRDIATKQLSSEIPSMLIAFMTSVGVTLMGLVGALFENWITPTPTHYGQLSIAAGFLILGYIGTVMTMRIGDVSFVAPFRYTYLIWAALLSIFVFNDIPDIYTISGSLIVVGGGIYSFWREQRIAKQRPRRTV